MCSPQRVPALQRHTADHPGQASEHRDLQVCRPRHQGVPSYIGGLPPHSRYAKEIHTLLINQEVHPSSLAVVKMVNTCNSLIRGLPVGSGLCSYPFFFFLFDLEPDLSGDIDIPLLTSGPAVSTTLAAP